MTHTNVNTNHNEIIQRKMHMHKQLAGRNIFGGNGLAIIGGY